MIRPELRQRLRRPALALLGLNVLAFLAFTLPRTLQVKGVSRRVATLQEEVARERAQLRGLQARAEAISRNASDAKRLQNDVLKPRAEALLPALAEVHEAAKAEGIELLQETFRPEQAKDGGPASVQIQLPIRGRYEQIVGFLARLERSKVFLVVEQLTLAAAEAGQANLNVVISAYFRERAGGGAGA